MAQFIVGIVKQSGDASHEALTRPAEEHSAEDLGILLDLCGVEVPGRQTVDKLAGTVSFEVKPGADLAAFVKPYIPSLVHAKKLAAEELNGGRPVTPPEEAAANRPASGKAPKAPKAAKQPKAPKSLKQTERDTGEARPGGCRQSGP